MKNLSPELTPSVLVGCLTKNTLIHHGGCLPGATIGEILSNNVHVEHFVTCEDGKFGCLWENFHIIDFFLLSFIEHHFLI